MCFLCGIYCVFIFQKTTLFSVTAVKTSNIHALTGWVQYSLRFYIPKDDILHSYHYENLKFYIELTRLESVAEM
jgi:hypothetical protein